MSSADFLDDDAVRALISEALAGRELAHAVNESGAADRINPSAGVVLTACAITLDPIDEPVWLHGVTTLNQNDLGTGTVNFTLIDYTTPAFIESKYVPLPNKVGPFGIEVCTRLESIPSRRTYALLVGNNPDANQTAVLDALNTELLPSRIWATRA